MKNFHSADNPEQGDAAMLSQKERVREAQSGKRRHTNADILAAMVEAAGPKTSPSEEDILGLILDELSTECRQWMRVPLPKQA